MLENLIKFYLHNKKIVIYPCAYQDDLMGGSPGDLSEYPVTYEKRKEGWRMSSDVGEATEGFRMSCDVGKAMDLCRR